MLCRGLRPGLSVGTPTAVSFLDLLRDVTIVRTLMGGCRVEGPGGGDIDDRENKHLCHGLQECAEMYWSDSVLQTIPILTH